MLIVTGVSLLVNALFKSIGAGVGNLVAEGDKQRIKSVFWELTSLRVWFASIVCFGVYKLSHSFITLWVGSNFILEQYAFIILIFITFIDLTRTNDTFLYAYGLFQDIWAPVVEAVLNLGLSILLGYFYGLTGILSGVLISFLLIVCSWKPFFLYKCGFKENIKEYVIRYLKYLLLIAISCLFVSIVCDNIFPVLPCTYRQWVMYAIGIIILYSVSSFILFICFDKASRLYAMRFKLLLIQKYKR